MSHTPGPWRLEVVRSEDDVLTEKPYRLAPWGIVHRPHGHAIETGLADARLIAAAPEMLEMLKKIEGERSLSYVEENWPGLRELLAKIEGPNG